MPNRFGTSTVRTSGSGNGRRQRGACNESRERPLAGSGRNPRLVARARAIDFIRGRKSEASMRAMTTYPFVMLRGHTASPRR